MFARSSRLAITPRLKVECQSCSPGWYRTLSWQLNSLVLAVILSGCSRKTPSGGHEQLPLILLKDKLDAKDIPELIAILDANDPGGTTENTRYRKHYALETSKTLGPLAKEVVPAIFRIVKSRGGNWQDADLRFKAGHTVNSLARQKVEGILPALLEALPDLSQDCFGTILSALVVHRRSFFGWWHARVQE